MKLRLTLALIALLLMLAIGTSSAQPQLTQAPPPRSAQTGSTPPDPFNILDCQLDPRTQQWSGNADDKAPRTWRASWSGTGPHGEHCITALFTEGIVAFAPDFRAIESISLGGYFELSESFGSHFRKLAAKPDSTGTIVLEWSIDGATEKAGGEEQSQLAALLLPLERCLAFSVETRLPALMQKGGLQAVLDETERLRTDYARSRYLTSLLKTTHLDESQVRDVIAALSKKNLSGQRGSIMTALAKSYPLAEDQTWKAFLATAKTITSDRDYWSALQAFLKGQNLSSEKGTAGLAAIAAIHDDNWKRQLLTDLTSSTDGNSVTTTVPPAYFVVLDSITSDADRAYVLQLLITSSKRGELSAQEVRLILQSTAKIEAEAPRGDTLERLASSRQLDDALISDYLQAFGDMESDSVRSRSLYFLLQKSSPGEGSMKLIIGAADKIHSSSERGRVLTELIRHTQVSETDLNLLLQSAARINSDIERTSVLDNLLLTRLIRDATVPSYLGVVRTMKSDADRCLALDSLLRGVRLSNNSVEQVLDAASSLHSDYDLSRVLADLAASYPVKDTLRAAYIKAAAQLKSQEQRDRAMAAVK
jgi:hypothetical protein